MNHIRQGGRPRHSRRPFGRTLPVSSSPMRDREELTVLAQVCAVAHDAAVVTEFGVVERRRAEIRFGATRRAPALRWNAEEIRIEALVVVLVVKSADAVDVGWDAGEHTLGLALANGGALPLERLFQPALLAKERADHVALVSLDDRAEA